MIDEKIKNNLKISSDYVITLIKWLVVSCAIGVLGGILGSSFHICIDYVTELRINNRWLIFMLPLGGILITLMYSLFKSKGKIDTNHVLISVREKKNVPLVMIPLIYISTVITHFFGGSAGREGAALQLGGCMGYNIGKLIKLKGNDLRIIIMMGMSSVFSAVFSTPLTAAVFSLEVINVGTFNYAGLLPCVISAVSAYLVKNHLKIGDLRFEISVSQLNMIEILKVIVLAFLCALLSIVFCMAIHKSEEYLKKLFKNNYLRAVSGSAVIIILTVLLNAYDYNGAGMEVIERAISGTAEPVAFLMKIIFTAITIGAGFKGGEIVPAFFTGATFGCVVSPILGINPGFGAAIGFISLFCGVVNCPIASIILALEIFGAEGIMFFAVACAVSYMMSGCFGLYKSQKIVYSKLSAEYIDINAN